VDALCIIQASKGNSLDWQDQSPRMGQYYANSVFTIAATWASDNNQGCLPPQWQESAGTVEEWHRDIVYSPLLSRAWVFQELSLSRRTVYLTRHRVFWHCYRRTVSQSSPNRDLVLYSNDTPQLQQTLALDSGLWDANGGWPWYQMISQYTNASLTVETDVFPALSGLCKAWEKLSHDEYLAGLWKSSIIQGLSWYCPHNSYQESSPKSKIPSWSWASTGRGVVYLHRDIKCRTGLHHFAKMKLVSSEIHHVHSDPHGQISSARIRLDGPIAEGLIVWHNASPSKKLGFLASVYLDYENTPLRDAHFQFQSGDFESFWESHAIVKSVPVVAIVLHHDCFTNELLTTDISVLLLGRVAGEENTFRRIGWALIQEPQSHGRDDILFGEIFGEDSIREIDII
jgi:hypothetical protein